MSNTPDTLEQKTEKKVANSHFFESGAYDYLTGGSSTEVGLGEKSSELSENEVIKSEVDNMIYMLPKGMYSIIQSEEAIHINRAHYTKEIISELCWIAKNHNPIDPSAMTGFTKLFNLIQEYTDRSPKDPFTSLLRSIYEGLVFDDYWLSLKGNVYNELSILLKNYNNRKKLTFDDIDSALMKLEKLGINPTPF